MYEPQRFTNGGGGEQRTFPATSKYLPRVLHRSDTPLEIPEQTQRTAEADVGTSTNEGVDVTQQEVDRQSGTDADADPDSELVEETDHTQDGYELPLDQLFGILKNRRRRLVLHYLWEHDGETTLSDVAEHIAAIENDTTVQAISSSQRKRVYVGLYQCHLPKMDDTDVIDFDQNRGTIELGPNAEQVEPYLTEPQDADWHRVYLSIALAGGGLFVIGQAGGASYGLTPAVVLIGLCLSVVLCVGIHARNS